MSLFKELKRRNVIRVVIAYVVVAWVLIQVGNILFSTLELGSQPGKILLAILLLGIIPAAIFAWAFEITPEGIKHEKDIQRDDSITNITAKKLDIVTIGLLIVAIGLFGLDRLVNEGAPTVQSAGVVAESTVSEVTSDENIPVLLKNNKSVSKKSIAVLPFVNMSSDTEQEYFSDGITEEILNALAKVKQLKVVGRTSSFAFKGKNSDLRLIGETLGVAHILEGSVRKAGEELRITAQLIKADDGFHLWSETYDGSLENIFDLQEDISIKVADELKVILEIAEGTRLASKMTDKIDAYDLFLRGRELVRKRTNNNIPDGINLLHKAVELDLNFAEAWAVLAEAEAVSNGYIDVDVAASYQRARAHIKIATNLDGKLVLPYAVSGLIKSAEDDHLGSIEQLEKALDIEPNNVLTLRWLGNTYTRLGYFDKGYLLLDRAFSLDPLSWVEAFNLALVNLHKGNLEVAKQNFFTANALAGEIRGPSIARILDMQGNHQEAIDFYMQMYEQNKMKTNALSVISRDDALLYARGAFGGDVAMKQAARSLGSLFYNGPDDRWYWQIAEHIQIENFDRAFEILNNKPEFYLSFSGEDMWQQTPAFIAFRADPRFARLLEDKGVTKAWKVLAWPDTCKPNPDTDGSNGQFSCE